MSVTTTPVTPNRAVRTASLAVFAVFTLVGVVFATWASRLPAIRDSLGLTPGQLGLLLLVGSAGSVVALPLTGTVVHRFGTALTTRAAALLTAIGFVCTSLALWQGNAWLVALLLFLTMMGISASDVSMNLQGTVVERDLGRAIMPRFHAGFSLGAVAGAAIGAMAAAAGIPVAWHISVVIVAAMACAWMLTTRYRPDGAVSASGDDGTSEQSAGRRALAAWMEPRTVLIGLMVLAAALTEGAATDWVALSVVDGFGASEALGALAFGLFVASMTLMRFAGTLLLDRYGRVRVVRTSAVLALVGLLAFGLVPSLVFAVLAIMLWGIGAALGFPVGMSAASDDPAKSAARVSVVSSIGYVAFLAGPPLLGMLADHVGYRHALLVIAIPLVGSVLLAGVVAPLPDPPVEPVKTPPVEPVETSGQSQPSPGRSTPPVEPVETSGPNQSLTRELS